MSQLFEGRVFDRVYVQDSRSAAFPVQAVLTPGLPTFKHHTVKQIFDQGPLPYCVAWTGTGYRAAGPISYPIDYSVPELYKDCQRQDQWLGESYDGSSILGLCRVFKKRGYITEYRWATTVDQVVAHILSTGPAMVGTTWYQSMSTPDKNGFIRIGGASVGGHAYLLSGCSTLKKCPDGTIGAFRVVNSWSKAWGQNGRAWLSFADFATLLADHGEAAAAIEAPLPRKAAKTVPV